MNSITHRRQGLLAFGYMNSITHGRQGLLVYKIFAQFVWAFIDRLEIDGLHIRKLLNNSMKTTYTMKVTLTRKLHLGCTRSHYTV